MEARNIKIEASQPVSGLLLNPRHARACFVFAHGAGAGMTHPFMEAVATGLFERGIATLRYQFPYMEKGGKRPDAPAIAHATVQVAIEEAARQCSELPLIAGGKSFGGRMTSQAQAETPLVGVRGIAFLGFPLHPAGKPSNDRAEHLFDVHVPMLFLQGTRDKLAELRLLEQLTQARAPRASLQLLEHADHSFRVPVRSGRTDRELMGEILDALKTWIGVATERIEMKRPSPKVKPSVRRELYPVRPPLLVVDGDSFTDRALSRIAENHPHARRQLPCRFMDKD